MQLSRNREQMALRIGVGIKNPSWVLLGFLTQKKNKKPGFF